MRSILIATLALAALTAVSCENKKLIEEQDNVILQMQSSRAAAAKAASAWEKHIEELNAEVLPNNHYSHDLVKKPAAVKHVAHQYHAVSHLKKAHTYKHLDVPHVFKHPAVKHQVKHAAAAVKGSAESHVFHDTAAAMYARRKAEVDAAFPASWSVKKTVKPAANTAKLAEKKKDAAAWAKYVANYRQGLLNKYQTDKKQEKIQASEMQTNIEHQQAKSQGDKEFDHLAKISEEVWPGDSQEKAAAEKHHVAISGGSVNVQPVGEKQSARGAKQASQTKQSSDAPVASAGTDVAYMGAHQAGYAKKPAAAAAAQRDIKAEHEAHRQGFAPTFAVKMEHAAKDAPGVKSARPPPTSSDIDVPEMGTNVVFEGASASGSTGAPDKSA